MAVIDRFALSQTFLDALYHAAKCGPGNGWKTKGKSGKCAPCEDDTYSDEEGFECKPCPEHHKLKTKKGEKATSPSQCERKF